MITLSQLTELLGWVSIINIGYLIFATLILTLFKGKIAAIHGAIFSIREEELYSAYFKFLANYKIAAIVFSITPYLALKIMGQ